MSKLHELGDNFQKLPDLLLQYEKELPQVEMIIKIEGKTLEQANKENPSWQLYFDQKRVELKTIVDYLEIRVSRVRSKLFKQITESNPRDLSDRAKEKFIDSEQAYLNIQELYLEAKEIYAKYQSVVDGFTTRGYALNNITKARVADVQDMML